MCIRDSPAAQDVHAGQGLRAVADPRGRSALPRHVADGVARGEPRPDQRRGDRSGHDADGRLGVRSGRGHRAGAGVDARHRGCAGLRADRRRRGRGHRDRALRQRRAGPSCLRRLRMSESMAIAELLDLFAGLRVADVRDGMDWAGLRAKGTVDPAIAPLFQGARATGIAHTVRLRPSEKAVPPLRPEEYAAWANEYWYAQLYEMTPVRTSIVPGAVSYTHLTLPTILRV